MMLLVKKECNLMFDPTAFENMRVVIEGMFYDKDLDGEIEIVDRNDSFNTANLSRTYQLAFRLSSSTKGEERPVCQLTLLSKLENLAAELLSHSYLSKEAGCFVSMEYFFHHHEDVAFLAEVEKDLKEIWGTERTISIVAEYETLKTKEKIKYCLQIRFDRIITEDQLDDFAEMFQYMIATLEKINIVTKK